MAIPVNLNVVLDADGTLSFTFDGDSSDVEINIAVSTTGGLDAPSSLSGQVDEADDEYETTITFPETEVEVEVPVEVTEAPVTLTLPETANATVVELYLEGKCIGRYAGSTREIELKKVKFGPTYRVVVRTGTPPQWASNPGLSGSVMLTANDYGTDVAVTLA